MFIDSSALVEILTLAPRRDALIERIETATSRFTTNATVLYETTVVLVGKTGKDVFEVRNLVLDFLVDIDAEILPITQSTGFDALDAFARYGKGRHPAKLNFGDCFAYAGARATGADLLYVGNDFALTDLA